jgi:hypothetical protein
MEKDQNTLEIVEVEELEEKIAPTNPAIIVG